VPWHALIPRLEVHWPGGQNVHVAAACVVIPRGPKEPCQQGPPLHAPAPLVGINMPAEQGEQAMARETLAVEPREPLVPGGHWAPRQAVWPADVVNWPEGHREHVAEKALF
jgi:hypothetical protein